MMMMMDMDMEMAMMAWALRMEECGYVLADDMDDDARMACIHEYAEMEMDAYDEIGGDPSDDGITADMIAWARMEIA